MGLGSTSPLPGHRVVAKCKSDNPEHHQDGSNYYEQMRKFHRAPHSFFSPSSTSQSLTLFTETISNSNSQGLNIPDASISNGAVPPKPRPDAPRTGFFMEQLSTKRQTHEHQNNQSFRF